MTRTNRIFLLFLTATIVCSLVVLLFPWFAENDLTSTAIVTSVFAITLAGAVWSFLTSLKAFKPGLKVAYYLLAIGIVFYSFVLLQFFLVLFSSIDDTVIRNILFLGPYGAASFFMYLGMRKFAKLLEIRTILRSFWVVFGFAIAASIAATQLLSYPQPLLEAGLSETALDAITGSLAWCIVFGIAAAFTAQHVLGAINQVYRQAMQLTVIALFALALSALHEIIAKIYFFDSAYVASDISLWPFVVTGIIFLRAGLAFRETQLEKLQHLPENASYLDIVQAIANLVSKPAAIGMELKKLQAITRRNANQTTLSQEDITALKQIYLYLEDYLVTREPLTNFDREILRENLPTYFSLSLGRPINPNVFHE